MKQLKKIKLVAVVFCLILTFSVFLEGCSDSTIAPVDYSELKNNPVEPVDLEISQFLNEWWSTLFDAPFNLQTSNAYMDVDVTQLGVYQGTTDTGEPFTVDVERVDYFDQNALLDISSEWLDEVNDYDMRISFLNCTVSTNKGETIISAFVSSGTDGGVDFHLIKPIDYSILEDSVKFTDGETKGFNEGWVKYYADYQDGSAPSKSDDCSANCQANSPMPDVRGITCPDGQTMNAACEADCKSSFEDDCGESLSDACDDLCSAYDTYLGDLSECDDEALEDWAYGWISVLGGPIGVLAYDAALIKRLRRCKKDAGDDYDTNVANVKKAYNRAVKRHRKAYRNCASECCEENEPEEQHELRDLIPW
jgi:hypothetical protein